MTNVAQKTEQKRQKVELDLTPRELAVLTSELTKPRKATGKQTVQAVAKKLGIGRTTYYKDLKKINVSDWKERQKERLKSLGDLALANIIHNLEKGNYDAGRDWFNKFAHLYTDQLDVVGRMQTLSDEELVAGMKTAILTALREKEGKVKVLPGPKESPGETESDTPEPLGAVPSSPREDVSSKVSVSGKMWYCGCCKRHFQSDLRPDKCPHSDCNRSEALSKPYEEKTEEFNGEGLA